MKPDDFTHYNINISDLKSFSKRNAIRKIHSGNAKNNTWLGNNLSENQRNTSGNTKKHFGEYKEIQRVLWENKSVSPRCSKVRNDENEKISKPNEWDKMIDI